MAGDFEFDAAGGPKRARVVATGASALPAVTSEDNPVVWETECDECGKRLAVRASIPCQMNADSTATYNLKCPKCGDRAVHTRPAAPAERPEEEPSLSSRVLSVGRKRSTTLTARVAWGAVAGFAGFELIRYETLLPKCTTVLQEISVSLICVTEVIIAFVTCFAFTSVLRLLVADPDGTAK